jgi:chromosome segregation ATPase
MNDTPETDNFDRNWDSYSEPWKAIEFARKLERERDEAREDASHWKIEYEIVEARLCGGKHERDNRIVSEREIIPKLQRERDEAKQRLKEIEEYGTEEINAAVDLRRNLAQALVDLNNMQDQRDLAMKVIKQIEQERDEANTNLKQVSSKLVDALHERDEAIKQIDNIRKMLSESGEAVGNGVYNYSIIEMIQNLIRSKSYFIRKSYSEFFKPKTNEDIQK